MFSNMHAGYLHDHAPSSACLSASSLACRKKGRREREREGGGVREEERGELKERKQGGRGRERQWEFGSYWLPLPLGATSKNIPSINLQAFQVSAPFLLQVFFLSSANIMEERDPMKVGLANTASFSSPAMC